MDELVFTPSAVLALLSSIEELQGMNITFQEVGDEVHATIGNSTYVMHPAYSDEVEIDSDSLDTISEANEDGYQELEDNELVSYEDASIEGGIIKELAKTLMLGGLVKLTKHALEKA